MSPGLVSAGRARGLSGLSVYPSGTCRQTGRFRVRRLDCRREYAWAPSGQTSPTSRGAYGAGGVGGERQVDPRYPPEASTSQQRRHHLRQIAREASVQNTASVLLPPGEQFPRARDQRENERKRFQAAGQQAIYNAQREARGGTSAQWSEVLYTLKKYSAPVAGFYEFKVLVDGGLANSAVGSHSSFNIWDIPLRTKCVIRLDALNEVDGVMTLSISGHEDGVRMALKEVIKAVGKLKAIRLTDPSGQEVFPDLWLRERRPPPASVLGSEQASDTLEDKKPQAGGKDSQTWDAVKKPKRYFHYMLTHRADDIPVPSQLTQDSLESYVASLVHARVPGHLHWQLYGGGKSHQQVVAQQILDFFFELDDWSVVTQRALYMTFNFTRGLGPSFRSRSVALLWQAVNHKLDVPIDVSIFNLFLSSCGNAVDLAGFQTTLKSMIRRGIRPDADSWIAFLQLTKRVAAKRQIVREMRAHGLDRMQSTLAKIGSRMAAFDLDVRNVDDMAKYIEFMDNLYGPKWLNQAAFNQILHRLGLHQRLDLCHQLIKFVHESGRMSPDVISLNTMLTHCHTWLRKIEFMEALRSRWSFLIPDEITFHIMFQAAWRTRHINVLRVVWLYATFSRLATSKMRDRLSVFLHKSNDPDVIPKRLLFVKAWQSSIFGEDALSVCRQTHGDNLSATTLAKHYGALAMVYRPQDPIEVKLREAYLLDNEIFQLARGDEHGPAEFFTSEQRKALTVQIPLVPREHGQNEFPLLASSHAPGLRRRVRAVDGGRFVPDEAGKKTGSRRFSTGLEEEAEVTGEERATAASEETSKVMGEEKR